MSEAATGTTVVAFVNMLDDASLRATGAEIASGVLAHTDHVVLSRMDRGEVVAVFDEGGDTVRR